MKDNCSRHKKEVAGIYDMKQLATMIGDLHYETLAELLNRLSEKLFIDYTNDDEAGRKKLANCLLWTYYGIHKASYGAERAWRISKTFMNKKINEHHELDLELLKKHPLPSDEEDAHKILSEIPIEEFRKSIEAGQKMADKIFEQIDPNFFEEFKIKK